MGIQEIEIKLNGMAKKLQETALKVLQIEALKSVNKNFDEGGRPRWEPSKKIGTKRAAKHGNKTLIDKGNLKRVRSIIEGNAVILSTDPLAKAYAKVQQEGATWKVKSRERKRNSRSKRFVRSDRSRGAESVSVKAHTITIPARPYMIVPPEDFARIMKAVSLAIKLVVSSK